MKKLILLLTILTFVCAATAVAEPIAPLAPLNALAKQALAAEGKTEADMLKDVPPKEVVGIPAYPGSYFGVSMGTGDVLNSVTLMSRDSPEKVVQWYEKKLGSAWQSAPDQITAALKEVGVFLETDKKNISAMDAMKLKQVRISKVENPTDTGFAGMMFDVTGIKTMINIAVTPLM
jgi:hypothetical protein